MLAMIALALAIAKGCHGISLMISPPVLHRIAENAINTMDEFLLFFTLLSFIVLLCILIDLPPQSINFTIQSQYNRINLNIQIKIQASFWECLILLSVFIY